MTYINYANRITIEINRFSNKQDMKLTQLIIKEYETGNKLNYSFLVIFL